MAQGPAACQRAGDHRVGQDTGVTAQDGRGSLEAMVGEEQTKVGGTTGGAQEERAQTPMWAARQDGIDKHG